MIDSLPVPAIAFHLVPGSAAKADWQSEGAAYGMVPTKESTRFGARLRHEARHRDALVERYMGRPWEMHGLINVRTVDALTRPGIDGILNDHVAVGPEHRCNEVDGRGTINKVLECHALQHQMVLNDLAR